jgi:hypothetical protein
MVDCGFIITKPRGSLERKPGRRGIVQSQPLNQFLRLGLNLNPPPPVNRKASVAAQIKINGLGSINPNRYADSIMTVRSRIRGSDQVARRDTSLLHLNSQRTDQRPWAVFFTRRRTMVTQAPPSAAPMADEVPHRRANPTQSGANQ